MSAGKIALGGLTLAVLIFAVDLGLAHFAAWQKRRSEFVRNERLNRYNVAAFRGARKFDDPRWPT